MAFNISPISTCQLTCNVAVLCLNGKMLSAKGPFSKLDKFKCCECSICIDLSFLKLDFKGDRPCKQH